MRRVLIVEDDPERESLLRSWLPENWRAVVATSAGAAIGILRLDRGRVYSAILLDHDLQGRCSSEADRHLSGVDVVQAIEDYIDRSVPVLTHSMSATGRAAMASRLRSAGFAVAVEPMEELTAEKLVEWLPGEEGSLGQ